MTSAVFYHLRRAVTSSGPVLTSVLTSRPTCYNTGDGHTLAAKGFPMVMVPERIIQRRLTFADYQALPDDQDYEIIDGVLYVAPRPRPLHQIVAYRVARILSGHTEDLGLGTVIPDADLVVADRDVYVSPDIMVFSGDRFAAVNREGWIRIIPDLIVEVLSPTTEDYDRRTKRETYARLGVPHFWYLDPRQRALTECILEPTGEYRERTFGPDEVFRPALLPDLTIDVGQLFA